MVDGAFKEVGYGLLTTCIVSKIDSCLRHAIYLTDEDGPEILLLA